MHIRALLLTGATLALITIGTAQAVPGPMGPSARQAAQLAENPQDGWIGHYLPADRYKIVGGIWQYVSTEIDHYYHRPDCYLALAEPAGRIIGFASAADAEEAGYLPDPNCLGGRSMGGSTKALRHHRRRVRRHHVVRRRRRVVNVTRIHTVTRTVVKTGNHTKVKTVTHTAVHVSPTRKRTPAKVHATVAGSAHGVA